MLATRNVRMKALRSRISACTAQLRPEMTQDAERWRKISVLFLDLFIAISYIKERNLRDFIAKGSPFAPIRLTMLPEEIDLCEAHVRNLERALRPESSTSTTRKR